MPRSLSTRLQEHLKRILNEHFSEDDGFIMGVSGGPDSMALLYLLHLLGRKVFVVHVNYGKRGDSSDKDQELVEQMAFSWGFECCSLSPDPSEATGQNFQNWAREKRYQFFRDLKEGQQASAIITAHHKDDQVETIFQKILRGSAPTAWQGMKTWDGEILRPLLPFDKEQILEFCESEAVPYRLDESNEESGFARNFIRNELSAKMDRLFPGWQQNLLDLGAFGSAYSSAIDHILRDLSDNDSINLNKLEDLEPELKRAVLKQFLDDHGLEGTYSKQQLHELSNFGSLQTGKSIPLGTFNLTRDRDRLRLHSTMDDGSPRAHFIEESEAESGSEISFFNLGISRKETGSSGLRLDASKLKWPLEVRPWESGDAFRPLGMKGSQNISDHLTNRKIPTILREKALVLCGSDSTIYAIIYPENADIGKLGMISELAKCESTTETFLTINF